MASTAVPYLASVLLLAALSLAAPASDCELLQGAGSGGKDAQNECAGDDSSDEGLMLLQSRSATSSKEEGSFSIGVAAPPVRMWAAYYHYNDAECKELYTDPSFTGKFPDVSSLNRGVTQHFWADPEDPTIVGPLRTHALVRNKYQLLVQDGGQWTIPEGICAAFLQNGGEPLYVLTTECNLETGVTRHTQYSDANCTVAISEEKTNTMGQCYQSTAGGATSFMILCVGNVVA